MTSESPDSEKRIDPIEHIHDHDDYAQASYPFIVFDERDAYGQLTGHAYKRCIECRMEMLTGMVLDGGFEHAEDCPVQGGDR